MQGKAMKLKKQGRVNWKHFPRVDEPKYYPTSFYVQHKRWKSLCNIEDTSQDSQLDPLSSTDKEKRADDEDDNDDDKKNGEKVIERAQRTVKQQSVT